MKIIYEDIDENNLTKQHQNIDCVWLCGVDMLNNRKLNIIVKLLKAEN